MLITSKEENYSKIKKNLLTGNKKVLKSVKAKPYDVLLRF